MGSARRGPLPDAVLLVGGRGTRLASVLRDRPKPMAVVAGRPFLEWLSIRLRAEGIGRAVFCTGYMSAMVEEHFGDGSRWGMEVVYSRDPFPLGTAGAIRQALRHLRTERFYVVNGDSYCPVDMGRLYDEHVATGACATIWTTLVEDCKRFGTVTVGDGGEVLSFKEKNAVSRSGLVNAGVYLLERQTAEAIPAGKAVSIETEFFPSLIGNGLHAVVGDEPLLDIGTAESLAAAGGFLGRHGATSVSEERNIV